MALCHSERSRAATYRPAPASCVPARETSIFEIWLLEALSLRALSGQRASAHPLEPDGPARKLVAYSVSALISHHRIPNRLQGQVENKVTVRGKLAGNERMPDRGLQKVSKRGLCC